MAARSTGDDQKTKRRSQRVTLKIPVRVEYFVNDSGRLSSDSVTVKVSAHGSRKSAPGIAAGKSGFAQNSDCYSRIRQACGKWGV